MSDKVKQLFTAYRRSPIFVWDAWNKNNNDSNTDADYKNLWLASMGMYETLKLIDVPVTIREQPYDR